MARPAWSFAAFAALGVSFLPLSASAQENLCGNRGEIVSKLDEHYKEKPAAVGVVDKNAVLEVFVSNDGTWTILATGTDGNSCVLSSGEGWESTTFVAGKDA
ncbi:MAG TPA: hypothetical protein VGN97_19510 [Mesorhizobium sp.]|jgi:hypothetical protein|nr:hypothetical protein [Mesorhizobium sp.]